MRRLFSIAILCLLAGRFSMAAALVQSNIGGNGTGTFTVGGTLTTSAVGFVSNTTVGSLLFMPIWIRVESTNATCSLLVGSTQPPVITTSGFTWSNAPISNSFGKFQDLSTGNHCGYAGFAYIVNAAQMLSSTTTTVAVTIPSATHCTCTLEFALYEISGVNAYLDGEALSQSTGAASNPQCPIVAGTTSIYICVLSAFPGSNLTAASGYTLGPNAGTSTIGQTSYSLAISGNTAPNFTGTLSLWDTEGVHFSLPAANTVARHRGWVF